MKLTAAAIFSLVATATCASPQVYPKKLADMRHSATNVPISVHMENHPEDRQRFMEIIENNSKSFEYRFRSHQRQRQQQKLEEPQEPQGNSCLLSFFRKGSQKKQKSKVENQKPKSSEEILQDWKGDQLFDPNRYGYRNGRIVYPECTPNNKRPNIVEPSDEVHAQLGTTSKKNGERIKLWEKTEHEKAKDKRPKYGYDFYQRRERKYQKDMQLPEGRQRQSEHIRKLEARRHRNTFRQGLEDKIYTAVEIYDSPEPAPKVIETEHHKSLKSILKKNHPDPEHERKVEFNPVVDIVDRDGSKKKGPLERKVSTKRFSFKRLKDGLKG
ncbi:hypothetical protein BASA50_011236 [Batrachochytrium salamandrivorans]|uniref:Uncharacterized protein n=1 Tax=Batrachochytrium salamandrivorans TaxID=1357716 RepID=A0ABQ8EW66_9FUNG|nr:hypothetical protein BASA50_011236 [Batrachochytrium salamandrivorans]KAH9255899.1 hypothetical protein BASA81_006077 [Batrachochytrium salamandrivorans]KAH9274510.1 hypothetical protein BASA83_003146 [Batrachochytrium salamandrivorans]